MDTTTRPRPDRYGAISKRLTQSTFGRGVAVLVGGAALGQFIAVSMTPVLTRLYTPAQFGVFEIWVGLMGLAAVLSTMRYPEAVPLAGTDEEASAAMGAAVVSSILIFGLSLLVVVLARDAIADATDIPELASVLWLLPFASLLHGFNFALQGWATRTADYTGLAKTKVRQSVGGVVTQIVLGAASLTSWGLPIGSVVAQGAGTTSLARRASISGIKWSEVFNLASARRAAWRFRRFPMFRAPASLVNALALVAPPLALALAYNKEVAGLYALVVRLLGLPTNLIGQSTMQVFYSEASATVRRSGAQLTPLLRRTARGLALISMPGLVLAALLAPWIIPLALGSDWADSARFVQLLAPMYLMRLVVTPVNGTFSILELQHVELIVEVMKTGLIVGAIAIAGYYDWGPNVAVGLISGAGVVGLFTSLSLAFWATSRFDRGDLELAQDRTRIES